MTTLKCIKKIGSTSLDASMQSNVDLFSNMKEQHSSLWEAWLQTL